MTLYRYVLLSDVAAYEPDGWRVCRETYPLGGWRGVLMEKEAS